jgi:hypothetical protein
MHKYLMHLDVFVNHIPLGYDINCTLGRGYEMSALHLSSAGQRKQDGGTVDSGCPLLSGRRSLAGSNPAERVR